MTRFLFICTGNIFRSLIAEHAMRLSLSSDEPSFVSSAGTAAEAKPIPVLGQKELRERGADCSGHLPRRLTHGILDEASFPIAIGLDHQEFVRNKFGRSIPLFNEVAHGGSTSIPDLREGYPDWREQPHHVVEEYIHSTIDHFQFDAAFDCEHRMGPTNLTTRIVGRSSTA